VQKITLFFKEIKMIKKILATTVLSLATLSAVAATKGALPYTGYRVVVRDAGGNVAWLPNTYSSLKQCLVAASKVRNSIIAGDSNSLDPSGADASVYCTAVEVFPSTYG